MNPVPLFALLISLFTWFSVEAAAKVEARPNVIFILTDDLGYGDLGVLYQNSRDFETDRSTPSFATPHLDRLAADGITLNRHYSGAPVCAPARASLLTGVHQGHATIRNNQFDKALDDNHTLGTVLREAGYATANIGKWGLQGPGSPENQAGHPLKRGFDFFFGLAGHLSGHYHYAELMEGKRGTHGQPCGIFDGYTDITDIADKAYSTDLLTARAKRWITDQQTADPGKPFFLYLSYPAPHAQLNVPTQPYPEGGGLSGGLQWLGTDHRLINTASGTIDSWIHPDFASATYDHDNDPATAERAWPDYAKRHATMVRRLDNAIGDLRQLLTDLNIDEDTLIVFTSDNGPHNETGANGAFKQDPRFFESYAHLDGIKRDLWEGGIRVPAIVWWPGGIPAGRSSDAASQFHDWMPTLAELAGVPAPARSDGVSLLPTLSGSGAQRPGLVYSEYQVGINTPNYSDFEPSHRGAVRRQMQLVHLNGYKGIRYNISGYDDDFLIYDTVRDPKEARPLTAGRGGVPSQQEFKNAVLAMRRPSAAAPRPYESEAVLAVNPGELSNGILWKSYAGPFPWVPAYSTLPPAEEGTAAWPDLSVLGDAETGAQFSGYLKVPADGQYTFYLRTDTGAFLRLHDMQLIDADSGYIPGTELSASVRLKAGYHPFTLSYRNAAGREKGLEIFWSDGATAKEPIPSGAFYFEGEAQPGPPRAAPDCAQTSGSKAAAGKAVWIDVLANDYDDGTPDPLTITGVGEPAAGRAEIEAGLIRYTPRRNFFGTDRFDYRISDGAESDTAHVEVTVYAEQEGIWLPFNEGRGNRIHDAGGKQIGILMGSPPPVWVGGKSGEAIAFRDKGGKLVLPGEKGVLGGAARTISFWLNANTRQPGGRPTILSWGKENSGSAGERFDINLNGDAGFRLRSEFNGSGVNFWTRQFDDLRGAGWVHCVIVVPENASVDEVTGYINGRKANTRIEPAGSGAVAIDTLSAKDITIGNWASDASRPLRGVVDELRILPRALSASEVDGLYSDD